MKLGLSSFYTAKAAGTFARDSLEGEETKTITSKLTRLDSLSRLESQTSCLPFQLNTTKDLASKTLELPPAETPSKLGWREKNTPTSTVYTPKLSSSSRSLRLQATPEPRLRPRATREMVLQPRDRGLRDLLLPGRHRGRRPSGGQRQQLQVSRALPRDLQARQQHPLGRRRWMKQCIYSSIYNHVF